MDEEAIPTRKARWWHSRKRRQRVFVYALLAIGLGLIKAFSWWPSLIYLAGAFAWLVLDWFAFRFFDPNYPDHDLEPASAHEYSDDGEGSLMWLVVFMVFPIGYLVISTFLRS